MSYDSPWQPGLYRRAYGYRRIRRSRWLRGPGAGGLHGHRDRGGQRDRRRHRAPARGGGRIGGAGRQAEAPLRQSADAVEQAGGRAVPVPADLADRASPARIIAAALATFGRIDGLVNNAAMCQHRPLPEWEADGFDEQVATNIRAPYFLIQAALRPCGSLRSPRWSTSALLGHLAAVRPVRVRHDQVRLDYLTQSLAGGLAGIRVNCIAPGPPYADPRHLGRRSR